MGWHRPDTVMFASRERVSALFGFLPAALALVLVAALMWRLDAERRQQMHAAERAAVQERLDDVGGRIAGAVGGDIKLSQGLVSALAFEPDMTQARYSALAEGLFSLDNNLRSLAAAPDLVVSLVYPLEENRRAIGLNYRSNPEQRDAALRTLSEGRPVVTGPIDLVQGGQGLIIRYPVIRHDTGAVWGIAAAVLDVDRLYRNSGLTALAGDLDIELERIEADQPPRRFFSTGALAGRDPVGVSIDLGHVRWMLTAAPKAGWATSSPQLIRSRLESAGIAAIILLPLVWAGVLINQRQRRTAVLQEREAEVVRLSQRLEVALSTSAIGVWELDMADDRLVWDQRMRELFSIPSTRSLFTYADWRDAVHPEDVGEAERALRATAETGTPFTAQFRILRPDGTVRHIRAKGSRYRTAGGLHVIGVNWDVSEDVELNEALREAKARADAQNSELRAARHSLEHLSMHDALTGLPNRRYLDRHLSAREGEADRLAILHVDLDRFKEINDTRGHAAGDSLLVEVGGRLLSVVGGEGFIARVGGDEFVVVTGGEEPARCGRALAEAIIAGMARPFEIEGAPCRIGCSVGLSVRLSAEETIRDLLVNADIALYEAKKQGRNRLEQFSDGLRLAAVRVKALSDELKAAVEQDRFVPVFQPQFDAHSLEICGVEVLARWNHPERGLLPPGEFLPVANDLGLSGKIDEIMLEKGLAQLDLWRACGLHVPKLSVNISLARLRDRALFGHLSRLAFEPGSLSFELLESISFEDEGDEVKAAVGRLKQAGVGIEIDDFGTGHASIVNLLELAPDRLKIDRKLIACIEASGARRRLVASIIEMGRALGIGTVAEGVETMWQAKILGDLGCDALQGYALARPMPAEDFFRFATAGDARFPRAGAAG